MSTAGYVLERSPDHPRTNPWGDVPQHRLVMECVLGRILGPNDIVHHVNGDKADNRPGNLEIHDRKSHHLVHHEGAHLAPIEEKDVRGALAGHTTAEAAELLGVHHQTLRNRFDHLLDKRTPPGGAYSERFQRQVRTAAANPHISTREAALLLDTTVWRIRSCCRRHGIEWVAPPSGRPSHRQSGADAGRTPDTRRRVSPPAQAA